MYLDLSGEAADRPALVLKQARMERVGGRWSADVADARRLIVLAALERNVRGLNEERVGCDPSRIVLESRV